MLVGEALNRRSYAAVVFPPVKFEVGDKPLLDADFRGRAVGDGLSARREKEADGLAARGLLVPAGTKDDDTP